jgi:hypothetical protein
MPNRVFVTSVQGTGDLSTWADAGGKSALAAGDAICQTRAEAAGLEGIFKAWLSDADNDAYCRVHNLSGKKSLNCGQAALPAAAGPWVRTDGFPFAGTIDQLVQGIVYGPPRTTESGVSTSSTFFTNTAVGGNLSINACSGMTSSAGSDASGGVADGTGKSWTAWWSGTPCSYTKSLLCLQTGTGPALPGYALPGKKMFITSTKGTAKLASWPDAQGNTGLAAGDAICRTRAAGAGLTNAGNFKALLSSDSEDALDRIVSDGPWVRVDGAPVAWTKADLFGGSFYTPVNLAETGTHLIAEYAWTGTTRFGVKQSGTCQGWTDETSASKTYMSMANRAAGELWSQSNSYFCSQQAHLFCIED